MKEIRNKFIYTFITSFLLLIILASCNPEENNVDPIEIPITAIEIQGSSNVSIGQETSYHANITPNNATNINITWSVISRGGNATIDENGNLEPTSAGGIVIRATASSGLYVEKNIVILSEKISVNSVTINGPSTFVHGTGNDYNITISPSNATYSNVEWRIVKGSGKIDKAGRLFAKKSGQLTIEVKVDGITSTKEIEVSPYLGSVKSLKVLSNRVDLKNTILKDYKHEFESLYPMYTVTFETLLDYENNSRMRLVGGDYGDVLLIPSSVSNQNLSYYFVPIGELSNLKDSWRYVSQKSYENLVYGLPTYGNVNGILYNKKVFNNAGINELPKTPNEFLSAMQTIKDHYQSNNTFVAPFYTNKKDGWPLDQWQGNVSSVSGDPSYYYNTLPNDENAFSPNSPHYVVYKLLYDLVADELIEHDPSTTNWERSKIDFVKGDIGAMMVGSWAVSQFVDVALKVRDGTFVFDDGTPGEQSNLADPEDIGYMPFPYTNQDGNIYSAHAPDFFMGISKRTKNLEGANDFILWFLRESGYYELTGGIPPRTDMDFPPVIKSFETMGVILFEEIAASGNMIGKLELVEANSGIVLWNPDWKRDLFEDAFYHRKSFNDIAESLNQAWKLGITLS